MKTRAEFIAALAQANISAERAARRLREFDQCVDLNAFQAMHVERERAAGAAMFMGLPDRWYEPPGPKWRCPNGHISTAYLKSEALGRPACLAGGCYAPLALTFPEDVEAKFDVELGRQEILGTWVSAEPPTIGSSTGRMEIRAPIETPQTIHQQLEPECPGPDCMMCNGEACSLCGAGCWRRPGDGPPCEHDVDDRHRDPT